MKITILFNMYPLFFVQIDQNKMFIQPLLRLVGPLPPSKVPNSSLNFAGKSDEGRHGLLPPFPINLKE
jgi:hypothetical protein